MDANINNIFYILYDFGRKKMITKLDENILLDKAFKLASRAHTGQVDKAGKPYIEHILYVVEHVKSKKEKILAYLHDIIEDTDIEISFIREEFGDEIAEALLAISHFRQEDYFDYIKRVKKNSLAKAVKIVDLLHNIRLDRLENINKSDIERVKKYKRAIEYLME